MIRYLLIALLFACANRGGTPQAEMEVPVSVEFKLAAGESKRVAGTDLTVRFLRLVSDSRCPAGVSCIWQGDGEIEVELNLGRERSFARLHTHGGVGYPSEASVSGYRVRLVGLGPGPANPPRPETEYVATLLVVSSRASSEGSGRGPHTDNLHPERAFRRVSTAQVPRSTLGMNRPLDQPVTGTRSS